MAYANSYGREKDYQKMVNFRKKYPKIDVEFFTKTERKARICESPEQVHPFLNTS